jgi:hypothetical protein
MYFSRAMCALGGALAAIVVAVLSGCAAPQKNYEVIEQPFLKADGGPVLIVDACIQQDAVGDADDYIMVTESKAGAMVVGDAAKRYLAEKGVVVSAVLVPFTCGVIPHEGNKPELVKLDAQLPTQTAPRPHAPTNELASDAEFRNALMVLATATHSRAAQDNAIVFTRGVQAPLPPMTQHTSEEIRAAIALVQAKTNASSVIYLNAMGISQSGGKAFALGAGRVFVGVLTGVATGVAIIPGGAADGSLYSAAAINLKSGDIVRASAARGIGDPKKPDVLARKMTIDYLMRGLIEREVNAPSDTKLAAK